MMEQNVKSLADTIGSVVGVRSSITPQGDAREYTETEKEIKVNAPRGERTFAQKWDETPDRDVLKRG